MKGTSLSLASMVAFGIGVAAAGPRIDVPIVVGGNDKFDACNANGQSSASIPMATAFCRCKVDRAADRSEK